jgi:hypothetical protein
MQEVRRREARALQSDLGEKLEEGGARPGGLLKFVEYFWHVLEPNTKLVIDMPMEAICLHLEAVTRGEITRLLINVAPGESKSLLVNVFWPAWEWSAAGMPWQRYVTFAYAAHLTERDNQRFVALIKSHDFRQVWGDAFDLTSDGQIKPTNAHTGWKFSSSMKGVGTGERGTRILADDLHNVIDGESEAIRTKTVRWSREGMSNRLNDMELGVIIMIGQRVHSEDCSQAMIDAQLGYVHLCIPNEYDPSMHCVTDWWEDPRSEQGELASIRFPQHVTDKIKRTVGPYAYSSQYQQNPEPRGGGILKREWWVRYPLPLGKAPHHNLQFVVASLDPAFTQNQENDPSGFACFGLYYEQGDAHILTMQAWRKWLELHGRSAERKPHESHADYKARCSNDWGLVEWVAYECKRLGVNLLLIENKASGHSVAQEMVRLFAEAEWTTQLIDPMTSDKRARAYAVQHLFAAGMVEAPGTMIQLPDGGEAWAWRDWADVLIDECSKFRGLSGDEDNLVDATTQAIKYLRDISLAMRREERISAEKAMALFKSNQQSKPLYPGSA